MTGTSSNTSGSSIVTLEFAPKSGSHQIPDKIAAELSSRAILTLENADTGPVVLSPTKPEDKTKVWVKTDAITGIPGQSYVWSEADNDWVLSNNQTTPYTPPFEQFFEFDAAAGASTKSGTFADMGRSDYFVSVEISTFVTGVWNAAPANMNNFGWCITSKSNTNCTFAIFAVPTGGLHFRVKLRNPE